MGKVVQCEIDEGVVNASKKFFPTIAESFEDPRLELVIRDAVHYVENCAPNSFDVIIVDSSDPVGPAEKLFSLEFYRNAQKLLTVDGVMASQGECLWIHQDLMCDMVKTNGQPFASVEYASIQVPTYPCGQISVFMVSKNRPEGCAKPVREPTAEMINKMRYYSKRMHEAAFVLPAFMERKLQECKKRKLQEC